MTDWSYKAALDAAERRIHDQILPAISEIAQTIQAAIDEEESEASMPNQLDRFTDHRRDGNTPVIVLPEVPEMLVSLAVVVLLEMMVLMALGILVTLIWIVG